MTTPKGARFRLGFRGDPYRPPDTDRDYARFVFLREVAATVPAVLDDLAAVPAGDEAALLTWAARWHLTDHWCLDYARATCRAWAWCATAPRVWFDRDTPGAWLPETPPPAAAPPALRDPVQFARLARYQCGERSYHALARAAGTDPRGVQRGCAALAALLGLTLRAVRPGRPRRTSARTP